MNARRARWGAFFWLAVSLSLVGWSAAAYRRSPAVGLRRTLADLNANRVESLQYDLLGLAGDEKLKPYALLLRGKLLLANRRYDEAAAVLSLAATHSVTQARAAVLYGEALYSTGRFLEAGKTWSSVLAADGENTDALRWLGVAYYDLGARQEATHYLEKAASLASDDPRPHHLIGIVWQSLGEWQPAEAAFEESLRRDPARPEAEDVRLRLADCESRLHKYSQALSLLDRCSESAQSLTIRAGCEQNLGHLDSARENLRHALALDPRNTVALGRLGGIEAQSGNLEAAARTLESLSRLAPSETDVHLRLASVYWKLGRPSEAKREKQIAEELKPIVEKYAKLREVATYDPTDARVRYELGNLAKRLHRIDEAKQWLRAAIYLEPGNQAAQEALWPLLSSVNSPPRIP